MINEQNHSNLLSDRLLLQMTAAAAAAQARPGLPPSLAFENHPNSSVGSNGLWRPALRPFLGKEN